MSWRATLDPSASAVATGAPEELVDIARGEMRSLLGQRDLDAHSRDVLFQFLSVVEH